MTSGLYRSLSRPARGPTRGLAAGAVGDVAGPVAGGELGPVGGVGVGDGEELGEHWCGHLGGELEQGGLACLIRLDADRDELPADVLGLQVAAGLAAGEQPAGVAGNVEAVAP